MKKLTALLFGILALPLFALASFTGSQVCSGGGTSNTLPLLNASGLFNCVATTTLGFQDALNFPLTFSQGGTGNTTTFASSTAAVSDGTKFVPYPISAFGGGGTNYWALTGVDIYNNNPGGVGIGQSTPLAELHVTPFLAPSNFSASITLAASGYSFGSGNKNYTVYAENSTVPIFSTGVSTSFSEPSSGIYDPSGGSASFSGLGGGYTASGYDFSYTVWALYVGQTAISIGNTATNDTGTDPNDGSTYNINVSWNAPSGGTPDAYLVLSGGSNPNGGQYQVVSGTSFTDTDSGWSGSASYSPLQYQVSLSYAPAGPSTDSYTLTNNTTTTFLIPGNTTSATDDNTSWTSGTPTITPTGQSKTAIFDGPQVDFNTVSYNFPNSQTAGFFNNDGSGNLSWRGISGGDITGFLDKEILFGNSLNNVAQSSNLQFDESSGQPKFTIGSGSAITNFNLYGDMSYGSQITDNSGTGVQNDFNVVGTNVLRYGNNSTTYTGFVARTSQFQKPLYVINGGSSIVTLANEDTRSSSANRITTGTGGSAFIPSGGVAELLYVGSAGRWELIAISHQVLSETPTAIGISTTTPQYPLTSFSQTTPQLALSTGTGGAQWVFRNAKTSNNLYIATTTVTGSATSTLAALTILGANGNVGIGTTSPFANLSVQTNISTGDAFVVATTSGATIGGFDNDGHRFTSGYAPVISSCGTGTGTVVGDDQSGTITTATAATACTLTFAKAYRATPTCTVTDNSLVGFADISSISTTAVTFGISSALTGGNLYYSCSYHK